MNQPHYYNDLLSSHLSRINDIVSECTLMDEATEAVIGYCIDWGLESGDFIIKMNRDKTFRVEVG